ncbi:unnamed protein product [Scytosiphon promiscuus]
MLPSPASQSPAISPSPGTGTPPPMAAEAPAGDQDASDAAADDAFFRGLYASALAITPPSSTNVRSPVLQQWPSSDGAVGAPPCDSDVAAAQPQPLSISNSGYPVNDDFGAPVETNAAENATLPAMSTNPQDAGMSANIARPEISAGLSGAVEKAGGARQSRKVRGSVATGTTRAPKRRQEIDPDDGEPDNTVCLLAVGPKKQQAAGTGGLHTINSAGSLADTIGMLTVEIGRNGRVTETEHVETGERAVVQVKALAECEMRFGIVVLEVEESLALAANTAKSLRAANDSTPIVAVGPPHAFRDAPAQLMPGERWLSFNEILVFPISAANVRGLVARYLLSPQHVTAVAVSSGLAGEAVCPGPTAAMTFGQLGKHTSGDGDIMMASTLPAASVAFGQGPSQLEQHADQDDVRQQGGLSNDATWVVPHNPEEGAGGLPLPGSATYAWYEAHPTRPPAPLTTTTCARRRRASSVPLGKPRASTLFSLEARVFGGGAEDRASPCKLFGEEFAKQSARMEEREYDFVFRHGTIVLRVAQDLQGNAVPVIFSACEYATGHFGKSFIGKPLKWLFDHPATNQKTVAKILRHIEQSDTDSMCSYINLRREGQWVTSSFASVRSLSQRPKRGLEGTVREEFQPEWYVLLKVCLPSTLGLIKEPELLESMYSKKATRNTTTAAAAKTAKRSRNRAGSKRSAKKIKPMSPAVDSQQTGDPPAEGSHLACPAPSWTQPG